MRIKYDTPLIAVKLEHIHRQKRNRRKKRVASNTPKNCRKSYPNTSSEPFACRWGMWSLTAARFSCVQLADWSSPCALCASAPTVGLPTVFGCIRCHSFYLLVFAFVDEYGPCFLLSLVYRILLAFIADTCTSGPINRWYSNPVNRLYSNTSSETRSSDSRLYGYIAQGDMFYLEKCIKMRVIW